MKKIIYLFVLAIAFTSCSIESVDSTENLLTADAKFKIQEAEDPMGFYAGPNLKGTLSIWNDCNSLYVEIIPEGDAPEDAELGLFSALPEINNGGNLIDNLEYNLDDATGLTWTISLSSLNTDKEVIIFAKAWGDWAGTLVLGKQEYSTYAFDLEDCCEESFTYIDNEDGTYTFTYTVGEDMDDADLVFTFAQGDYVSGLSDEFSQNGNGQTYEATMDLEKCDVLEYIVTLTPKCTGNSNSNVWTDFKVNEVSKKADQEDIFTASCH